MGETVSFPVLQARATAKDLRMLKGISLGEISEQSQRQGLLNPGANHLGLYTQARYLWDADQTLEPMLDEYYELFYGPARDEMRAAFEFAEEAFAEAVANASGRGSASPDNVPIDDRIQYVHMLQDARETAGDTIYGQRIQLILDELESLDALHRMRREQAETGESREDAPLAVAREAGSAEAPRTCFLKEIETGEAPDIETSFQVTWEDDALVFDIRCEEPDMDNLIASSQVWDGDSVAILLETPTHAYYQIEINPDGKVYNADRGGVVGARWQSQVDVTSERGTDFWRLQVRVPVVSPAAGDSDPNHNVAGPKPGKDTPWFFNVGRARFQGSDKTAYGFSPTGGSYHVPERFGRLEVR